MHGWARKESRTKPGLFYWRHEDGRWSIDSPGEVEQCPTAWAGPALEVSEPEPKVIFRVLQAGDRVKALPNTRYEWKGAEIFSEHDIGTIVEKRTDQNGIEVYIIKWDRTGRRLWIQTDKCERICAVFDEDMDVPGTPRRSDKRKFEEEHTPEKDDIRSGRVEPGCVDAKKKKVSGAVIKNNLFVKPVSLAAPSRGLTARQEELITIKDIEEDELRKLKTMVEDASWWKSRAEIMYSENHKLSVEKDELIDEAEKLKNRIENLEFNASLNGFPGEIERLKGLLEKKNAEIQEQHVRNKSRCEGLEKLRCLRFAYLGLEACAGPTTERLYTVTAGKLPGETHVVNAPLDGGGKRKRDISPSQCFPDADTNGSSYSWKNLVEMCQNARCQHGQVVRYSYRDGGRTVNLSPDAIHAALVRCRLAVEMEAPPLQELGDDDLDDHKPSEHNEEHIEEHCDDSLGCHEHGEHDEEHMEELATTASDYRSQLQSLDLFQLRRRAENVLHRFIQWPDNRFEETRTRRKEEAAAWYTSLLLATHKEAEESRPWLQKMKLSFLREMVESFYTAAEMRDLYIAKIEATMEAETHNRLEYTRRRRLQEPDQYNDNFVDLGFPESCSLEMRLEMEGSMKDHDKPSDLLECEVASSDHSSSDEEDSDVGEVFRKGASDYRSELQSLDLLELRKRSETLPDGAKKIKHAYINLIVAQTMEEAYESLFLPSQHLRKVFANQDADWIEIPYSAIHTHVVPELLGRELRANDVVVTAMDEAFFYSQLAVFEENEFQSRFPIKVKKASLLAEVAKVIIGVDVQDTLRELPSDVFHSVSAKDHLQQLSSDAAARVRKEARRRNADEVIERKANAKAIEMIDQLHTTGGSVRKAKTNLSLDDEEDFPADVPSQRLYEEPDVRDSDRLAELIEDLGPTRRPTLHFVDCVRYMCQKLRYAMGCDEKDEDSFTWFAADGDSEELEEPSPDTDWENIFGRVAIVAAAHRVELWKEGYFENNMCSQLKLEVWRFREAVRGGIDFMLQRNKQIYRDLCAMKIREEGLMRNLVWAARQAPLPGFREVAMMSLVTVFAKSPPVIALGRDPSTWSHLRKHALHTLRAIADAGPDCALCWGVPACPRSPSLDKRASATELMKGCFVMRGADWCWGEQDGGPDSIGVVTAAASWGSWVRVEWVRKNEELLPLQPVNGVTNVYRWGFQGYVDLVQLNAGEFSGTKYSGDSNSLDRRQKFSRFGDFVKWCSANGFLPSKGSNDTDEYSLARWADNNANANSSACFLALGIKLVRGRYVSRHVMERDNRVLQQVEALRPGPGEGIILQSAGNAENRRLKKSWDRLIARYRPEDGGFRNELQQWNAACAHLGIQDVLDWCFVFLSRREIAMRRFGVVNKVWLTSHCRSFQSVTLVSSSSPCDLLKDYDFHFTVPEFLQLRANYRMGITATTQNVELLVQSVATLHRSLPALAKLPFHLIEGFEMSCICDHPIKYDIGSPMFCGDIDLPFSALFSNVGSSLRRLTLSVSAFLPSVFNGVVGVLSHCPHLTSLTMNVSPYGVPSQDWLLKLLCCLGENCRELKHVRLLHTLTEFYVGALRHLPPSVTDLELGVLTKLPILVGLRNECRFVSGERAGGSGFSCSLGDDWRDHIRRTVPASCTVQIQEFAEDSICRTFA